MCQEKYKGLVEMGKWSYLLRAVSALCCRRSSSIAKPNAAFTLVEIIIVVVIIAIAAMVAIPLATSAASVQIRSAANMITADLEYAKSLAISKGQNFSVVFNKDTETYSLRDKDAAVIPHPVKKGFDYIVDFSKELSKVDIVDADFDNTAEVRFDYLGSPYNAAGNPLNSGVVTLKAGATTVTVNVEPVTGFISVN